MKERCPEPQQLVQVATAAEDHPWQTHLQACPRCRAVLASRDAFLNEGAGRESRGEKSDRAEADAETRLEGFIRDLVVEKHAGGFPSWLMSLAALVLVAIGLWALVPQWEAWRESGSLVPGQEPVRMRGGQQATAVWAAPRVAIPAAGGLDLAWEPFPGADGYLVIVRGADLQELARLEAGPQTRLVVAPGDLPPEAVGGYVTVVADKAGREIGRSASAALP